jgi:hypothetical protein
VFLADDVVDLTPKERVVLMDEAVLTEVVRAFRYEPAQVF